MKLRRAEAIRYGGMSDATLGTFEKGLNVVFGSNEAGKSTFAALIRHVVFDFPRRGGAERDYLPPGDENRAGRLVFEDEDGAQWALTRSGTSSKGTPKLVGPHGESNATTFIDQIKSGVSADLYRHVFGFGLEELAEFESLTTIQDHLHAGVTGLEKNPREVLSLLDDRAGKLFLHRGHKRLINSIDRELKETRKSQRKLVEAAGEFADDRQELARVEELLALRRDELRDVMQRAEHLAALAGQVETHAKQAQTLEDELVDAERAEAQLAREIEDAVVDDALLERGSAVDALASRLETYDSLARERREIHESLSQREEEVASLASVLGAEWDGAKAIEFRADPINESTADTFATKAERLEMEADQAGTKVERGRAVLDEAEARLHEAAASAGMADDVTAQEVAAARAGMDGAAMPGVSRTSRPIAAIGLALVGLAAVAWGLFSGDPVTLALGVVSVLASVVTLILRSRSAPGPATGDSSDALRLRGALEVLAKNMDEVVRLRTVQVAEEQEAAGIASKHAELSAQWVGWCEEHDLETTAGPAHARDLIASTTRLAEAAQRAADSRKSHTRAVERMDDFESSARGVEIDTQGASPEAIAQEVHARVAALASAREAEASRKEMRVEQARLREALVAHRDKLEHAQGRLADLLDEAQVTSPSQMEGALAAAREVASQAQEEVTRLSNEQGELVGLLKVGGQEDQQAAMSLQASELEQRLSDAIERYAVLALAARMLRSTLAEYERDSQPAVIHTAEKAFSAMTDGRYCNILNPLGEFDPMICGVDGQHKDNEILSTGTAQQLYLALRLAYIENLGGRGPMLPVLMDDILVNFDDDRRAHTAQVLTEFARGRQVILFTCHERTVDTFVSADPATQVIRL